MIFARDCLNPIITMIIIGVVDLIISYIANKDDIGLAIIIAIIIIFLTTMILLSTDTKKGNITKLNFFEDKGKITGKSEKIYEFEFSAFAESGFQREIKKDVLLQVSFEAGSTYKKPIAIKIRKRVIEQVKQLTVQVSNPAPVFNSYISSDPNRLFSDQRYEEALELFCTQLKSGDIEKEWSEFQNV